MLKKKNDTKSWRRKLTHTADTALRPFAGVFDLLALTLFPLILALPVLLVTLILILAQMLWKNDEYYLLN